MPGQPLLRTENKNNVIGKYWVDKSSIDGIIMCIKCKGDEYMPEQNKIRTNITIDPDVLAYIDDYAKRTGISRSGAIAVMVSQFKSSMEGIAALTSLAKMAEQDNALKLLKRGD